MEVGDKAFLKKRFTEQDILLFATLTEDNNPVHLDDHYASTTIFKKRVVHGMLTASLISAVLGTKLPGPGAIYLNQEIKFIKPVFINDEVLAEVEVIEIKKSKSIAVLRTNCYTNNTTLVLEGIGIIKF